ncbi:RagB/SusD family nutrient uptake outer membrane protein [Mucilaginibacter dorajii]|uniref:RagB/SusD family nutrient uptake outer membrane protein n=1 Tax=Mucilaginibacter dorajii TaxID=692994 RepID=A0ABP7QKQ9_9SPHI|nr:RagB/SusD family nutrient uptake outer membrane protein [Mucilaginibacter dorajii]MCS3734056.1 hypothetical protein [Mucilaginibacter dorajii]
MINKIFIVICLLTVALTGCKLESNPSDSITTESITKTADGLTNAVNGAYSLFKDKLSFNDSQDDNLMYLRNFYQLSDFASDDVVCGQVTTDPLFLSFSLEHSPTQTNAGYLWYISYKIINTANTVIEQGEKGSDQSALTKQLIGECYFLRAYCHFNLVRLFAKPYTVDPNAPGIILRTSSTDNPQKARASVKDVYASVVQDAIKGVSLMNQARGVQYGSKEAAEALLSRVALYQGAYQDAINYSNQVINSGRFTEVTPATYPTMFSNAMGSTETIFCIAFTTLDDYGKFGSIASQYYSDGNSGWGEEFASKPLRDLYAQNPTDIRITNIVPLKDGSGNIQLKNGIPTYYVNKFSFQGGSPTLSSPILFRLSEMYLNRAEAEANLNQTATALNDVDMIRKNRGLSSALYNGVVPANSTLLQTVLKERRLELAFEGHRTYDVYRNKQSMNRTYWGYHLPGLKESDINLSVDPANYTGMIIPYTSTKIIYYLPIDEILSNKLATQNP